MSQLCQLECFLGCLGGSDLLLGSGMHKGSLVRQSSQQQQQQDRRICTQPRLCARHLPCSQPLLLPPEQGLLTLCSQETSSEANTSGQDLLEGRWRRLALVGVFLAQRPMSRRWFPWAGWNLDGGLLTSDASGQGYCAATQKTRNVKMGA